jgi:hypothetical protein
LICASSLANPVHAASVDLTVESVWVEQAAYPGQAVASVAPGDQFNIVASVKNIGDAPASGYYLDVYYDSDYGRGGPDNIAPGEVQTWYVGPLTAQAGTHTTKWVVDPDNQIAELDESNNQKEYTFTIGSQNTTTTTTTYSTTSNSTATSRTETTWTTTTSSTTSSTLSSTTSSTEQTATSTVQTIPATPGRQSFFHPSTEFWFSRYDMKNSEWDAIHIANTGTQNATVQIYIAGAPMESVPISIPPGGSTYRTYPGVEGGPLRVAGDQPIWVTQRVLGWTAMQEICGAPVDEASTELIWTWYDLTGAQADDIYVVNPSPFATAHVTVYVAGAQTGTLEIGPGQSGKASFPGVIGGPLKVVSDVPIFASQRVVGWNDFDEIVGLPTWYTFSDFWFNWYDMQGADWDAIHMLNPGTTAANVQIYINGVLKDTLTLPVGGADYRTFPGVVGGPVHVVSDQPIWVTQRIIGWGGWKEVFAVPVDLMSTKWYFTWYDMKDAQWDAIHFLNPGTSEAHVTVTIAGTVFGTYTVPAGETYYVSYSGVCGGPVIIESDGPIMAAQRIVGWGSYEETLGAQWT